MEPSERELREQLRTCLARLGELKAADLVRQDLGPDSFRGGLPYFRQTLELYQRITPRDCARAPAEYLKIVANHAGVALQRFEEILHFDPASMTNPAAVRSALIEDVREAYKAAYEDVVVVIAPKRGQAERLPSRRTGQMLAAAALIAVLALAISADHYIVYNLLTPLRDALEHVLRRD